MMKNPFVQFAIVDNSLTGFHLIMPRLRHYDHDGRVRFVTFSTYRRIAVFSNARFRNLALETLDRARERWNVKLLAYVIMPDHVHLVLWPPDDVVVSQFIGEFKRESSRQIHEEIRSRPLEARLTQTQQGRTVFQLWQLRCYDHNCRTDESVWEKVNYCHWNPVKKGLAHHPEDWVWSSYRSYAALPGALLEVDRVL